MTANKLTDDRKSVPTTDSPRRLRSHRASRTVGHRRRRRVTTVHGTLPVRVKAADRWVKVDISLGAGEIRTDLSPDRAEELAATLLEGADQVREAEE